jgi:acyl-CoA reductase-like NAD-dependent aldehyde dehydrogenase
VTNQLLIAGEWTDGQADGEIAVHSPATGEHLGAVPSATTSDVDAAVAGARKGAAAMEAMPVFERAALLHRVADLIEEHAEEIGRLIALENGKPLTTEAAPEVDEAVDNFRWSAEEAKRLETPNLPGADPDKLVMTFRKPNGVYAIVSPWNFPLGIPAELLAPGLAGGNACVLKPSEYTPLTAALLVRLIHEAGFPSGAVSLVFGDGDIGRTLVSHEGVDAIAFVGSQATADAIVRAAGLKRTLIEASGNGPQIVLDDALLPAAAEAAVNGASFAAGQCCVATERLLVHESVHDELLALVLAEAAKVNLGNPLDPDTTMGPLNNEPVAINMDRHLADAADAGVEVLTGGKRAPGHPTDLYYEFTVADRVGTDTLFFREESFGPVVPITTFRDDDEALRLANASDLGLQAAVFTSSLKRTFRFVNELRAGSIVVNDTTNFWEPHPPFGGASGTRTGWGRIGGKYTLMDMTDLRTAVIDVKKTRD